MRKLDYEFIFTCGIVAFIAALGMVAGIVVLAGAKMNNDKVEKRTKHRYCSDSI